MPAECNGCRVINNAYIPRIYTYVFSRALRCARFRSTPLYGAYRISKNPVIGALFALVFFLR